MPIVLVQKKSSFTNEATTITTTFDAPPTDGNLLVLMLCHRNGEGDYVDITGGPWDIANFEQNGATRFAEMDFTIAASHPSAVTITFEANKRAILALAEYSGIAATDPLDAFSVGATDTVSSMLISSSLEATQQGDELLIAQVSHFRGTSAPTWTDSFVAQDNLDTGSSSGQT